MKLKNNFKPKTRLLFLDNEWECGECGGNGQDCGGLELHHITSRDSNSALNGIVLCKKCHGRIGHTEIEEIRFFTKTFFYLLRNQYCFVQDDFDFIEKHKHLELTFKQWKQQ